MKMKTTKDKIIYAEDRSAHWLAEANIAEEEGHRDKAEIYFRKSAFWLMRANKLRKW